MLIDDSNSIKGIGVTRKRKIIIPFRFLLQVLLQKNVSFLLSSFSIQFLKRSTEILLLWFGNIFLCFFLFSSIFFWPIYTFEIIHRVFGPKHLTGSCLLTTNPTAVINEAASLTDIIEIHFTSKYSNIFN